MTVAAFAVVLALAVSGIASGSPSYARYYVDELVAGHSLEAHGLPIGSRKVAVDNASCDGLRRYGVRSSRYGLDRFWRFKCFVSGADDHFYDVWLSFTRGPRAGFFYRNVLRVRRSS